MNSPSGRRGQPSAVLLDGRTVHATPASGAGAGSRARGISAATPANDQDRACAWLARVRRLARGF